MDQVFSVRFLPGLADPQDNAGCDLVVTDILRATTTIVSALSSGAVQILPTPEIGAGIRLREQLGGRAILGGERKGVIIPGYDQGNSPREYGPELVAGRTVILCTSNGTVAMESARGASRILIGAFVNLAAVAASLQNSPRIAVICSGTDGRITSEDVLFAGALAERLGHGLHSAGLDDSARIARGWWETASRQMGSGETTLHQLLRQSAGGRNLVRLDYDADIQFCARQDLFGGVPLLDEPSWSIRLAGGSG